MKDIIEKLRGMVENPDDISAIPNIIETLQEVQQQNAQLESDYQERVMNLQQANRSLISQIPIAGNEPGKKDEEEHPTFEQAQEQLLSAFENMRGQ